MATCSAGGFYYKVIGSNGTIYNLTRSTRGLSHYIKHEKTNGNLARRDRGTRGFDGGRVARACREEREGVVCDVQRGAAVSHHSSFI